MKFYTQNKICISLGIGYDNTLRKQNPIISSAYRFTAIYTGRNNHIPKFSSAYFAIRTIAPFMKAL